MEFPKKINKKTKQKQKNINKNAIHMFIYFKKETSTTIVHVGKRHK